jgi:hypothetical protein
VAMAWVLHQPCHQSVEFQAQRSLLHNWLLGVWSVLILRYHVACIVHRCAYHMVPKDMISFPPSMALKTHATVTVTR